MLNKYIMAQNIYQKEFTFKKKLYKAVSDFIAADQNNNFSEEYVEAMKLYRKVFTKKFCGVEYKMPLMKKLPGSTNWNSTDNSDVNFGNIWEGEANRFIKPIRDAFGYKPWPNKITEFPDFKEDEFVGDFKSAICSLYADTKANRTRNMPIGYLAPDGCADLCKVEDYKKDIKTYLETGKLSDHLTAMLVFAIYEYKYDEKTGEKYAIVYDVMVLPALFCINFRTNGELAIRSGKITIGFYERNIDFIAQKNFGI